jgi:hypothetical protein
MEILSSGQALDTSSSSDASSEPDSYDQPRLMTAAPVVDINITIGSAPQAISSSASFPPGVLPRTANPTGVELILDTTLSEWLQQEAFPSFQKAHGDILAACKSDHRLILGMLSPAGYGYPAINWEHEKKCISLLFSRLPYSNLDTFQQEAERYKAGKSVPLSVAPDPLVLYWPEVPYQMTNIPSKVVPIRDGSPNTLWLLLVPLGTGHEK